MFFNKRGMNQNKLKPRRRRRKILDLIIIISLLFGGKARVSSSQSSSPNFDNKIVYERIIYDQEFCSNDQQVILVKTGDSTPSVPTSPGRGQTTVGRST